MKIFVFYLLIFIIFVFLANNAFAQKSGTGIGIILGEPTGLSFKSWMTQRTAFDAAVAWSFTEESALHLHADYLIHNFSVFRPEKGELPFYYGIGGRLKMEDESRLGVRVPFGLNYIFQNDPVDIFIEIVPLMDIVPETEFTVNAAIGVRYYF